MLEGMRNRAAPVEYTVAVDRYLDQAALGVASRRVYRISLVGWAWPLVGRAVPSGAERRSATPPLVPLALLDDPGTGGRLAEALAGRAARADARTVNRELSALRSAVGWWRTQGWVSTDPTSGLRHRQPQAAVPAAHRRRGRSVRARRGPAGTGLLAGAVRLGRAGGEVLALDAHQLDLSRHRVRPGRDGAVPAGIEWQGATSQVLRWLLSGRTWGPVFLTDRRRPRGPRRRMSAR